MDLLRSLAMIVFGLLIVVAIAYHAMRYKLPQIEARQSAQAAQCLLDQKLPHVQIVPLSCEVVLRGEVEGEAQIAQVEFCAQTYVTPWRALENQLKIASLSSE